MVNGFLSSRLVAAAALVCTLVLAAGCEKDPNEASTWIPKLGSAETLDEAIRNLERLKDLKAVRPLGEAWKKWNKPSKILRAMINIASFNDPEGKVAYIKRVPDFKDAMPYLVEAVDGYDPSIQQSIDDAAVACEALGKSGDPAAVEVLVRAAVKAMPKTAPANRVRVSAIKALGNFKDPRAVKTLITILGADPETQDVRLHAAAALALAETGDPSGLPALAKAAFVGPIYNQVRQGFTRAGKPGLQVALEIYLEKQPDVVAFAKEKDFAKNAPGAMVYKGALLLGNLRATDAVPQLVAGLKKPTQAIGFDPRTGAEYGTSHAGILDALRRIGNPKAADAVYDYMIDEKTDDFILRPVAISVYATLATDTKALPWLQKCILDEEQEAGTREACIFAFSMLGKSQGDVTTANKTIATLEARSKEYEGKLKTTKDEQGKFDIARKKEANDYLMQPAKDSVPRLEIAVKCTADKDPMTCYADTLDAKDLTVGQPGVPRAERALIEIRKMGPKAEALTDKLLQEKYLGTGERPVREALLMALTRIAKLPCKKCADAMSGVLAKQANQTTMDLLNIETRVVYHFFLWAGT